MAPAQHLMGHLLLLAVCPKAPHSLNFNCAWKRTAIRSEKVPENSQVPIKEEIFKSYFPILFRQGPIVFGLLTARFLNDNMLFPLTLLGRI
jgi:hypothetical protein